MIAKSEFPNETIKMDKRAWKRVRRLEKENDVSLLEQRLEELCDWESILKRANQENLSVAVISLGVFALLATFSIISGVVFFISSVVVLGIKNVQFGITHPTWPHIRTAEKAAVEYLLNQKF